MSDTILYHHRTRGRKVEGVHIRSVANALRNEGYRVDIMSVPGADPEAPEAVEKKPRHKPGVMSRLVGLFADRAPEFLFEFAELAYNLVVFWRVGRYLRRHPPRWIYERYSLFLFATVVLARRHGIPIVLEVSDSAVRPRVRPLLLRRLATRIEAWIFNHCDGLVFVSTAFHDQVLAAHGTLSRSIISPNAADVTRFDPSRYSRDAIRERLGLTGKRVCGYLGAFIEWHGIHRFVDGIAPRLPDVPDLRLLLVGDGKTRPWVQSSLDRNQVADRAVMTGHVTHDDVPELVAAMDFAVLPDSNTYGSPMKLFELMAMGVPVVAPDYGPVREVIENGRTGWLFTAGDMKACIERVLSLSDGEVKAVGLNARLYVISHRQWRNNALQLIELYRRIESERGARSWA